MAGETVHLGTCPKCRAAAGTPCRNYRGVKCAPHSGRQLVPGPAPGATAEVAECVPCARGGARVRRQLAADGAVSPARSVQLTLFPDPPEGGAYGGAR